MSGLTKREHPINALDRVTLEGTLLNEIATAVYFSSLPLNEALEMVKNNIVLLEGLAKDYDTFDDMYREKF